MDVPTPPSVRPSVRLSVFIHSYVIYSLSASIHPRRVRSVASVGSSPSPSRRPGALELELEKMMRDERCRRHTPTRTRMRASTRLTPCARVVGLGDPVTDVLCRVSRADALDILRAVGGGPDDGDDDDAVADVADVEIGGCVAVRDATDLDAIVARVDASSRVTTPGGSAANVLKGLAGIARGTRENAHAEDVDAAPTFTFIGTVEDGDAVGAAYETALTRAGVEAALVRRRRETPPLGSARCVCLVDEGGQRTMRTYLGAAAKMTVDDVPMDVLARADVLHAEGYALYKPEVLRAACAAAKANGALVSLDLASFEVVRNRREALEEILRSGVIDVVFCNEDEARELARGTSSERETRLPANGRAAERPSEETETEAMRYLLRFVEVATCSRGKRGCVSMNAAGERAESSAEGVTAIDTTGAGDTFTSGFLHAYLAGGSLRQCGDAGCAAGAEIVQVRGAEMDDARWRRVAEKIERVLRRE